jgi:SNF family Na+-dependent transporter
MQAHISNLAAILRRSIVMSSRSGGRDAFSSALAATVVALGSAVGLGNIWKFPYMTGTGGGGAFLVLYLFFVFIVALPVMVSEFVIGRRSRLNAVGSFRKLDKQSPFALVWHRFYGRAGGFPHHVLLQLCERLGLLLHL